MYLYIYTHTHRETHIAHMTINIVDYIYVCIQYYINYQKKKKYTILYINLGSMHVGNNKSVKVACSCWGWEWEEYPTK